MGSCSTKTIQSGLINKGFRLSRKTKHLIYVYYTLSGKKTPIQTMMSMSPGKEISPSLVSLMANQVRLKVREFEDLCNCPLLQKDYEQMLINKKEI